MKKIQERKENKKEMERELMEKLITEKVKEKKDEKYEKAMKKQEEEIEKLKWKREMNERRERKNNSIIRGIGQLEIKDSKEVSKWFKEDLDMEVEVDYIWHIGDKSSPNYLLGARLHDWENKRKAMENKSRLKGKEGRIFIDNDLTMQKRNVRRTIGEEVRKIKESKKGAKLRSGYYWLQVGEKRFTYEERGKKPGFIEEK